LPNWRGSVPKLATTSLRYTGSEGLSPAFRYRSQSRLLSEYIDSLLWSYQFPAWRPEQAWQFGQSSLPALLGIIVTHIIINYVKQKYYIFAFKRDAWISVLQRTKRKQISWSNLAFLKLAKPKKNDDQTKLWRFHSLVKSNWFNICVHWSPFSVIMANVISFLFWPFFRSHWSWSIYKAVVIIVIMF
jgi:hypothetical protein